MLKKLRLMILEYIKTKKLNHKIIMDDEDLFLVHVYYGENPNFKFEFALNKTTFRWNDCGFFGIYEDEFRPMTEDGMNELFSIANKCIEYGYKLSICKNNKEIIAFKGIDEKQEFEADYKKFIKEFLPQHKHLITEEFDSIGYENFKQNKKVVINKKELDSLF